MLLDSFFYPNRKLPKFRYDLIRPAGVPLKTFGGLSSGPDPLIELHQRLSKKLFHLKSHILSSKDIVDIMNMIGCCVVAGNIRRSAEIAFGDQSDT